MVHQPIGLVTEVLIEEYLCFVANGKALALGHNIALKSLLAHCYSNITTFQ